LLRVKRFERFSTSSQILPVSHIIYVWAERMYNWLP